MKDKQRIISLYFDKKEFESGAIDVTEKLYEKYPRETIEAIKYMMPTSTESGIYFTIVVIDQREKEKKVMGFGG
ncbi:MAG: hypothetical protein R3B93_20485 [Bacteroidia bacterium]